MTKKQVWRYFCEFCGKGSLSGGHMGRHEKHCTANPSRICRFHALMGEGVQASMKELLAAVDTKLPDCGIGQVRELAAHCPMCILATIRQSGIAKWDGDPESQPRELGFDFKAEVKAAWDTINEAKAQDANNYY